jgi:transcriptional regulator with XRE-family HTH domain
MPVRMGGRENEADGPVNGLEALAQELRAHRELAGLTQEQLAKLMGYSASVIAKLETCRTIPSPQHADRADEALGTPGTFRRMRQAMINGAYEPWVRAFLDMEERATVLRQRVGDALVMREQLGRLVEAAENPRITIQIMPFTAAAHPGLLGPFVVASFEHGPDAAYLDSVLDGQVSERRKQVEQARLLYDTLAREALSPGASAEMIVKVADERWRT